MSKKLFGTDGIRGTANQFPMTNDIVLRVGQALGHILKRQKPRGSFVKVLIGKDTRLSGYMIEMALASGLNSTGVHVQLVGPLPTPGIGYLARNMRADAGIVISASHNPFYDNGIKIFGPDGYKISDEMEKEIEDLVLEGDLSPFLADKLEVGRSRRIEDSTGRYVVYVKSSFPLERDLEGMRIVLDCANGAAYKVAPTVFEELGAETFVIGNHPNGTNINDECGALFPERTAEAVLKYRADVGICLDGDADRVIMVDEQGNFVNGDHILAICGLYLKRQGKLPKNSVVCTHMSNYGLHRLLKQNGIDTVTVDVGDKHVVEEMRAKGYSLGGEQSGHIIFMEHSTTGDGLIAALNVIAVMAQDKKKLSDLSSVLDDLPQVLKNIRITKKTELEKIKGYPELLRSIQEKQNGNGRVYVRFSGTEALARVLVEGESPEKIAEFADQISSLLQKELN